MGVASTDTAYVLAVKNDTACARVNQSANYARNSRFPGARLSTQPLPTSRPNQTRPRSVESADLIETE